VLIVEQLAIGDWRLAIGKQQLAGFYPHSFGVLKAQVGHNLLSV
jgi:hypothetical protein